jgi:hypothetical protein
LRWQNDSIAAESFIEHEKKPGLHVCTGFFIYRFFLPFSLQPHSQALSDFVRIPLPACFGKSGKVPKTHDSMFV